MGRCVFKIFGHVFIIWNIWKIIEIWNPNRKLRNIIFINCSAGLEISVGHRAMSGIKTTMSDVKSSYVWRSCWVCFCYVFFLKSCFLLSKKILFLFKNHSFLFKDTMDCIDYYVILFVINYHVSVHVLYFFSYPSWCSF